MAANTQHFSNYRNCFFLSAPHGICVMHTVKVGASCCRSSELNLAAPLRSMHCQLTGISQSHSPGHSGARRSSFYSRYQLTERKLVTVSLSGSGRFVRCVPNRTSKKNLSNQQETKYFLRRIRRQVSLCILSAPAET